MNVSAGNQKIMSEINTWARKKKGKNSGSQVKLKAYLQLGTHEEPTTKNHSKQALFQQVSKKSITV